jgi:hypothetical protein
VAPTDESDFAALLPPKLYSIVSSVFTGSAYHAPFL